MTSSEDEPEENNVWEQMLLEWEIQRRYVNEEKPPKGDLKSKTCKRGHPWKGNLAVRKTGTRYCRLCNRRRALESYYRRLKK